jgi:hypothetical protein
MNFSGLRTSLELFFKNQGLTVKILDLKLITQKSRGLFAKFLNKPGIRNYFLKEIQWTWSMGDESRPREHNPPWIGSGLNMGSPVHGGALPGARPPAAPGHESLLAGVDKREESMGN